jgi:hypothetical protein
MISLLLFVGNDNMPKNDTKDQNIDKTAATSDDLLVPKKLPISRAKRGPTNNNQYDRKRWYWLIF